MTDPPDLAVLVRAAAQYAREAGYAVERYEAEDPVGSGGRLTVLFHAPQGRPGEHFSVEFDGQLRPVAVHPGE
jgi:hypothetical protein